MIPNSNKSYSDFGENPVCFERGVLLFLSKSETNLAFSFPSVIIPNRQPFPFVLCEEREGIRRNPSLKTVSPESLSGDKMAIRKQNSAKNAAHDLRERSATSVYLDSTDSGVSITPARMGLLISGWLLAGDIKGHSPGTLANYRTRMKLFQEWCEENGVADGGRIGKRAIMLHLSFYRNEKGVSPSHLRNVYVALQAFFNWCVKEGYLESSPMAGIEVPSKAQSKPHPFTAEEVAGLLAATLKTQQPRRDEAIFRLVLDTGIRSSELCDLRVCDVNLDSSEVWIRKGKGGKSRAVPIVPETRKAIFAYLSHSRPDFKPDEPLFLSTRGHTAQSALTRIGIYKMFAQWAKDAGISRERIGAHTVRHTFGSGYISNGGDPFSLKIAMGHSSLSTTMLYVEVGQDDLKRKHAQFSPASGLKADRSKSEKTKGRNAR